MTINKRTVSPVILTVAIAGLLALCFWPFTLEDTWIFLALGDQPVSDGFLAGATSMLWGGVAAFVEHLFGSLISGTALLKVLGGLAWIGSALLLVFAIRTTRPDQGTALPLFIYGLLPYSLWVWSGMDTSLSMLWTAGFIALFAESERRPSRTSAIATAALVGSVYLVRPELAWVGPFWLAWRAIYRRSGTLAWETATVVLSVGASLFTYQWLSGSLVPTSSVKISTPQLISYISGVWAIAQIVAIPLSLLFIVSLSRLRVDSIGGFFLLFCGVRLVEHVALGGIDQRALSVLGPAVVFLWANYAPTGRLSSGRFALVVVPLIILFALNVDNARWYSERTENVHMKVLSELSQTSPRGLIGTEEVGLVAYEFGVERVLDYHHLIGSGLDSLSEADTLVFTGSLKRREALAAGFQDYMTYCFKHRPTLYVRSVGFSPEHYCKTIYVRDRSQPLG